MLENTESKEENEKEHNITFHKIIKVNTYLL